MDLHRSSCWSYGHADESAPYRMLKMACCEHAAENCEINRRYLASQAISDNLQPDGTVEA